MSESENETRGDTDSSSDSASEKGAESSDSSSAAAAETPAESSSPPVTVNTATSDQTETLVATHRREDRLNWMEGCNKTLTYLNRITRDKSLHFRSSDKITTRLLVGALIGALVFATFPYFEMRTAAAFCYILADISLLGAILVFVISRFGIIRAMEPRHALVCWHLMVGTGLLALVIGFNLIACVVLFMLRDKLQILIGGG